MLDHLHRDDSAKRSFGLPLEVGDGIAFLDLQALRASSFHHSRVGVDASRVDPCFCEEPEQLPSAAADIQNRRVRLEQCDVGLEQLVYALLRAAEDVLEGGIRGAAGAGLRLRHVRRA